MAFPVISLLSVKQRLILLGVATTLSLGVLIVVNNFTTNREESLDKNSVAITQIRADILTLRHNERDFRSRLDLKYTTEFNNTLQEVQSKTESLEKDMAGTQLDTHSTTAMSSNLQKYAETFGNIVTQQKKIGLNPKDGLYGALRDAVHNVEKKLETVDDYKLLVDMLQLRRNEKDFMLRLDTKYVDEFSGNLKKFTAHVESSNHPKEFKDSINALITQYNSDFLNLVAAQQAIGLTPETGMNGQRLAIIKELEASIAQAEEAIYREVTNTSSWMDKLALIISSALAMLNLVLLFWVSRSIAKPTENLSTTMSRAHRERDLTQHADIDGNDEIARMGEVFNAMLTNFKELMQQISDTSTHLGMAAHELAQITDHTNDGMIKQRTESDMVASAMNQMSSTVLQVSRNANAAADASRTADEQANRGSNVVNIAIAGINTLAEQVRHTSTEIKALEQESHNISTVLNVIRDIAEQTNLLALNAAIEAARAGEQGRGFAVVADEVRTLAQRSQQSTQEINDIITRLQAKSLAAARSMEAGLAQTQESVIQAEAAGRALSEITQAVTTINDMNIQIASAAEEQSAVTEEINRNIVNITQIAGETADGTAHIIKTSHSLAEMAEELNRIIGQFRTH